LIDILNYRDQDDDLTLGAQTLPFESRWLLLDARSALRFDTKSEFKGNLLDGSLF
jgi:hypothetical protein